MILKIDTEQDVIHAISKTKNFALDKGMESFNATQFATIVSELSYNIIKYANHGFISLHADPEGIKIVAKDKGEGIKDIDKALSDGYSSSGTLGIGLPGIIRLSDDFDITTSSSGTEITVYKKFR